MPSPPAGQPSHDDSGNELLSGLCHDLRGPLSSVTMGASYLLGRSDATLSDPRVKRMLQAMLKACTHMDQRLDELRDFAELRAKRLSLDVSVTDASVILERVAERVHHTRIPLLRTLSLSTPAAKVTLLVDEARLVRALAQLVAFVAEVQKQASSIDLSVVDEGASVAFRVTLLDVPAFVEAKRRHRTPVSDERPRPRSTLVAEGLAKALGACVEWTATSEGLRGVTLRVPRSAQAEMRPA